MGSSLAARGGLGKWFCGFAANGVRPYGLRVAVVTANFIKSCRQVYDRQEEWGDDA